MSERTYQHGHQDGWEFVRPGDVPPLKNTPAIPAGVTEYEKGFADGKADAEDFNNKATRGH